MDPRIWGVRGAMGVSPHYPSPILCRNYGGGCEAATAAQRSMDLLGFRV